MYYFTQARPFPKKKQFWLKPNASTIGKMLDPKMWIQARHYHKCVDTNRKEEYVQVQTEFSYFIILQLVLINDNFQAVI